MTDCYRSTHLTNQYRHSCTLSASVCSWCSLSLACSAFSSHSPFPGARADWLCGVASGAYFWTIIVVTTIVGVTLSFIYAPRTWCSFCPMGTISRWVAPKKAPLPKAFTNIHVSSACQMKCKSCARVCPMQLTPYDSRGQEIGYLDPDCLKCGKCTQACPSKIMTLKNSRSS